MSRQILSATLDSLATVTVALVRDWEAASRPPVEVADSRARFRSFVRAPLLDFARPHGYAVDTAGQLLFVLDPEDHPGWDAEADPAFLAGDFNGWGAVIGQEDWRLCAAGIAGREVQLWRTDAVHFARLGSQRFKFVTASGRWLDVPWDAPNLERDSDGSRNRRYWPERTGWNLFRFELREPAELSADLAVRWSQTGEVVTVRPGAFFFELKTDRPLGALATAQDTTFRLFAPRARTVELAAFDDLQAAQDDALLRWQPLVRQEDGSWELRLAGNRHGQFYWYRLDGPRNAFSSFDPARRVLDPWALAAADSAGPAIVVDLTRFPPPRERAPFRTPQWQDLVVVEAHVRDLVARAPLSLQPAERLGFTGLARWVRHRDFYVARLGANAVELQPVQEFDNLTREEYHWGYMPVAYFAPESSYALEPARASQVPEFQDLVGALHARGMAVILDVVYNHAGEPNPLYAIDRLYWFETAPDGSLLNWSGCGNDLRCRSAMARRLIVESCTHLIRFYGVDGFRFDLAELIGREVLVEVERELKAVKPDVILIAEPWSFRGHLAGPLKTTGWASWNDGYRNYLRDFVCGRGDSERLEYFLKGSPGYFAEFPAQTVNYSESHDDRTWIDTITTHPDGSGFRPTAEDIARTHLMLALLLLSTGVPMLAAGQDFLRSKHGVNNTYQRGDLNALDYRRLYRHPTTHDYTARWIALRRSPDYAPLLCPFTRPPDAFWHFYRVEGTSAFAVVLNATGTHGAHRLLFACNPHGEEVTIPIPGHAGLAWHQLCDHEVFFGPDDSRPRLPIEDGELYLPPLGCALWAG